MEKEEQKEENKEFPEEETKGPNIRKDEEELKEKKEEYSKIEVQLRDFPDAWSEERKKRIIGYMDLLSVVLLTNHGEVINPFSLDAANSNDILEFATLWGRRRAFRCAGCQYPDGSLVKSNTEFLNPFWMIATYKYILSSSFIDLHRKEGS
jgi:hypothetical protein